jgi:hypothetical protein
MKFKNLPFFQGVLMSIGVFIQSGFLYVPSCTPTVLATTAPEQRKDTLLLLNPELLRLYANSVVVNQKNGAIGVNRDHFINIGSQRYSSNLIGYGLVTKNVSLIDTGIKTLEYAFQHQNQDGSFQDHSPGQSGNATPGSVAFFYHDLGESLLLCQKSQWFEQSRETAELRRRFKKLLIPTATSLKWLMRQQELLIKVDGNGNATNRLFVDALAFYLVGSFLNNTSAIEIGEHFVVLALQQQTKEGFFREKRGFDSSYQGVSLFKALVLYSDWGDSNVHLRTLLWNGIQKGITWEKSRISSTGEVSTEGNSRVHPGGEIILRRVYNNGQTLERPKTVDYLNLIMGFNYYSHLSGDQSVQEIADLLLSKHVKRT